MVHVHASQGAFAPVRGLRELPAKFVGFVARWSYVAALLFILYQGWLNRNEGHLTAEEGIGYWLGIGGATALVVLLVYPFRKRLPFARWMGSTPFWFRMHMAFGLLAPTVILLHSNFRFGSANSSVALTTMLVVAVSGLVGRYLYGRVYRNLVGGRIEAASLFDDVTTEGHALIPAPARARLIELTEAAIMPRRTLLSAIDARLRIPARAKRLSARIRRNAAARSHRTATRAERRQLKRQRAALDRTLREHRRAVRQACSLAVHERAFALWHVLHLPLFFLLLVAVVVHVTAVHLY